MVAGEGVEVEEVVLRLPLGGRVPAGWLGVGLGGPPKIGVGEEGGRG